MATRREMCQDYSDESSHSEASEFNPYWHNDYGLTEREYIKAYYDAFVRVYKPGEMEEDRNNKGYNPPKMVPAWKQAFHYYLVEVIEWVTESEFAQLYFEV